MSAEWMTLPPFVAQRLRAAGVDVDEALRRAGAAPGIRQGQRLDGVQFLAFWAAVEQLGAPADFGLQLVADVPPDQYDVASIAALHSASLGEALGRLVRYKRLTCPETIEFQRHGGELRVHFRWEADDRPQPSLLADSAFAWLVQLTARGLGRPVRPLRLELARRPGNRSALKAHFGCPLQFNAPRDLLVLDGALFEAPFCTHNPLLLELMVPGLESALRAADPLQPLESHVKRVLARHICGERPSVAVVAAELRISPRTLQRRLIERGTSYQRLLDEVRQDCARRLLAETDLGLGEIAFLLGYAELNSFARAFQDWEGTTPARWRDGARQRMPVPA